MGRSYDSEIFQYRFASKPRCMAWNSVSLAMSFLPLHSLASVAHDLLLENNLMGAGWWVGDGSPSRVDTRPGVMVARLVTASRP